MTKSGISLIEVVIAVAIFAAAAVSIFGLFSTQIASTTDICNWAVIMNITEGQLHKYVQLINNLDRAASETIYLVKDDITSEVILGHKTELHNLVKTLKMYATVVASPQCPDFGYDVLIETTWGSNKKFNLSLVVPVREVLPVEKEGLGKL